MIRLFALLVLAACAAPPRVAAPIPLRNPTAPIASQANVTVAGMAGDWIVVQGVGIAPGTRLGVTEAGITLDDAVFAPAGRGRFMSGEAQLWVHWLDVGARTAAVGDPQGSRVWIMDRAPASSPDRLTAAREILDWYGYDLTRMRGL